MPQLPNTPEVVPFWLGLKFADPAIWTSERVALYPAKSKAREALEHDFLDAIDFELFGHESRRRAARAFRKPS
jgi:hypothetical protein